MTIAKILVPVSGALSDGLALAAAMVAARPFAAHVQALYVPQDPRYAIPYVGAPIDPSAIDSIEKAIAETNRQASKRAQEALAAAAKLEGATLVKQPERKDRVTCSFKEDMGFFALRTGLYARLSDLVVFSSLGPDVFSEANEAFVETLIRTERPVLVVPTVPVSLTGKVCIAWDGSSPCAHALTTSMPFLRHSQKVELLEIDPVRGNGVPASDAKDFLALHQVVSDIRRVKREDQRTAEAIMHAAHDGGADLLVMGAYGHNRFAEAVLGGVTTEIKWHAKLPVLMAH
ncbi:MAG TPA: universal stress protein [Rhizomicrobium sp.]|jgi:nucleotide-binding universal stress UspA family protein|nr:universal stress protein [Rhizomicrobium sp.]